MNTIFKITSGLLEGVRADLARPHPYAAERVGWISAGLVEQGDGLLVLAREYRSVEDDDYLDDPTVGAMMGADAIRKARQWAMNDSAAIFHVHTHGGNRIPWFSRDDIEGHEKYVRNFFGVAPTCAHGALVLSDRYAAGKIWTAKKAEAKRISRFVEVSSRIEKWGVS